MLPAHVLKSAKRYNYSFHQEGFQHR